MIYFHLSIFLGRSMLVTLSVLLVGCGGPVPDNFERVDSELYHLQDSYKVIEGSDFRNQAEQFLADLDKYGEVEEARFRKAFVLNMIAGSLKHDDRHADSISYAEAGLKLIRSVSPRQDSRQSSDTLFTLELAFLQNLTWSYEHGDDLEMAASHRSELIELLYVELTKSHQRCGMTFKMLVEATIEQNRYYFEHDQDEEAKTQSARLAAFNGCDGLIQ